MTLFYGRIDYIKHVGENTYFNAGYCPSAKYIKAQKDKKDEQLARRISLLEELAPGLLAATREFERENAKVEFSKPFFSWDGIDYPTHFSQRGPGATWVQTKTQSSSYFKGIQLAEIVLASLLDKTVGEYYSENEIDVHIW